MKQDSVKGEGRAHLKLTNQRYLDFIWRGGPDWEGVKLGGEEFTGPVVVQKKEKEIIKCRRTWTD